LAGSSNYRFTFYRTKERISEPRPLDFLDIRDPTHEFVLKFKKAFAPQGMSTETIHHGKTLIERGGAGLDMAVLPFVTAEPSSGTHDTCDT